MLLNLLQQGFIYIVACVLLLGILIFVHELGHFMVARWYGVRVEVFSLGFGKKIWKRTVGDTTYCVSMIPLGGYVKMFGDQPGEELPDEEKKHSFTHKPVGQRIAVVLAGPLMNFFFAILVFAVIALIGTDAAAPVLGDVDPGTAAARSGFQSGDRILKVAGQDVETLRDVEKLLNRNRERSVAFTVQRPDGTALDLSAEVTSRPNPNPLSLDEMIGEVEGLTASARASVVGVRSQSPLHTVGLRTADRVSSVNGTKVETWRQLEAALEASDPSQPLVLEVERYLEKTSPEKLTLTLAAGGARTLETLRLETPELYLARVVPSSPAEVAGLKVGDRLLSIDGRDLTRWEDVLNSIKSYDGKDAVQLVVEREGEKKDLKIVPQITTQMTMFGTEDKRYTIGIQPAVALAMPELVTIRTSNPVTALVQGVEQTWHYSVVTVLSFVRLFQNKVSAKSVGGIISIGQAAGETLKLGISKFLMMMAIISVNLFILNLLPVPVLDGGHLVFYTIELIKGSPLSLRKIEIAQQVGLLLLFGLMGFALFNDVTRVFLGRM